MIKKIKVDLLRPGVYITDFNCSWLAHPFLTTKKRIKSYKDIEKIKQAGISEVFIDTTKGIDIFETLTREQFLEEFKTNLEDVTPADELDYQVQIPLEKELKQARQIQHKAHDLLKRAYQDIRYGNVLKIKEFAESVNEIIDSVTRNRDALLLLSNIKAKDEYTYEHSVNVSILAAGISKALKMDKDEIFQYTLGAILHDIGKSKIPEEILKKQAPLTQKEYNILKKHVELGIEILSAHKDVTANTLSVIAEHHERLNGTGYPKKLSGSQISLGGKLGGILDVYDALTSERVYHTPVNPVQALKEIYTQRDILFEEELIQQFIKFLGIYPPGSLVKLGSGFLAIVIEAGREDILKPIVRIIYDLKKNIPILPRNLDLSKGVGDLHYIEGMVNPAFYNININEYLLNMLTD